MNQNQKKIYKELINKYDFSRNQKDLIYYSLKHDLDVTIYAKPEFNYFQMEIIRVGLEDKVDVSIYAKSKFNEWKEYVKN